MDRWFVIWVHLVGAAVLVGGAVLLAFAVIPFARRLPDLDRAAVVEGVGRRFRALAWLALLLLFATGLVQLSLRGFPPAVIFRPETLPGRFGQVLAWKLGLFVVLVLLSLVHDLYVGPRALRLVREAQMRQAADRATLLARAERLRRISVWVGRVNLLVLLALLYLGVVLSRS